jgi:hypothetical protein
MSQKVILIPSQKIFAKGNSSINPFNHTSTRGEGNNLLNIIELMSWTKQIDRPYTSLKNNQESKNST